MPGDEAAFKTLSFGEGGGPFRGDGALLESRSFPAEDALAEAKVGDRTFVLEALIEEDPSATVVAFEGTNEEGFCKTYSRVWLKCKYYIF